jgi:hypothetical protein
MEAKFNRLTKKSWPGSDTEFLCVRRTSGNWSAEQKSWGGGNMNQEPVATRLKTPCETIAFLIN